MNPQIIEKAWGVTRCIHHSAACEVWHASIRIAGQSSRHYHAYKANDFYVLSGVLTVEVNGESYQLGPGEALSIVAGTKHQFFAHTPVELIETYWLGLIDSDDIEREEEMTGNTAEQSVLGPSPASQAGDFYTPFYGNEALNGR